MDTRELIDRTMKNMDRIYRCVGEIVEIVDQKMRNAGFQAIGKATCTWAVKKTYDRSDKWLFRQFARAFEREGVRTKFAGFCIHLGEYLTDYVKGLEAIGVRLPAI